MRGKAAFARLDDLGNGITPAYAGKSNIIKARKESKGDHPRVCGEKEARGWPKEQVWGSPPRMRGKD